MIAGAPARPPLRYFGGKWRIADWVISHFPAHECYVEPFGGGASVLLKKHPSRVEVYNDIDQSVVTFFKVLRERPEELVRAIETTPFSRQEVKNALEARRDGSWLTDELECARQFYVLSRQCQGGASRQDSSGWRFARTGKSDNDAVREWNKTDHMWAVAARLKNVQIECDEALAIVKRFDSRETLFYVDPPYVLSSRSRDRRGMYKNDLSDEEHRALAEKLSNVRGMVLLSGYPSPLYEELYGEWEQVTMQSVNNAGNYTTECLWLSPNAAGRQVQGRMEFAEVSV